jgi:hypothetical protein
MSDTAVAQRNGVRKIPVECRTCGVSESFYSNLSVDKFKLRHNGHDVVSGYDKPAPRPAKPAEPTVTPAPMRREPLASKAGIKIAKVMVDVLNFASLGSPMVRVRGFDAALDEAFTATLLLKEGAKIKEMFETGSYLDQDASGLLYVWEPDVVEYVDAAKAKLDALGAEGKKAGAAEPIPDSLESGVANQVAVESATAAVMDAVRDEAGPVEPETPTERRPPAPAMEEPYKVPSPSRSTPERPAEPLAPSQPARPVEKSSMASATPQVAPAPAAAEEDGYLLVSKSWYIQGGNVNRKEAQRISNVLKAFRWKVEPVYTIGVMLDNMLSIETSRTQISGTLIKRIENAGYKLTAVATDQGKPVAWFKRGGSETGVLAGEAESDSEEPGMELDPDVTG